MNNKPIYHRLQHIVNRNSNLDRTLQQILAAFDKTPYDLKPIDDKTIIEKFFKECDAEDYEKLLLFDEITTENIKAIYLASPASRSLYRGQWDDLLKLDGSERYQPVEGPELQKCRPRGLEEIVKMRQKKSEEH